MRKHWKLVLAFFFTFMIGNFCGWLVHDSSETAPATALPPTSVASPAQIPTTTATVTRTPVRQVTPVTTRTATSCRGSEVVAQAIRDMPTEWNISCSMFDFKEFYGATHGRTSCISGVAAIQVDPRSDFLYIVVWHEAAHAALDCRGLTPGLKRSLGLLYSDYKSGEREAGSLGAYYHATTRESRSGLCRECEFRAEAIARWAAEKISKCIFINHCLLDDPGVREILEASSIQQPGN